MAILFLKKVSLVLLDSNTKLSKRLRIFYLFRHKSISQFSEIAGD